MAKEPKTVDELVEMLDGKEVGEIFTTVHRYRDAIPDCDVVALAALTEAVVDHTRGIVATAAAPTVFKYLRGDPRFVLATLMRKIHEEFSLADQLGGAFCNIADTASIVDRTAMYEGMSQQMAKIILYAITIKALCEIKAWGYSNKRLDIIATDVFLSTGPNEGPKGA